ncbi:MAG: hypothetical protein A2268_00685 [Candidatus Raymondbacteria bacterium RifOxyA12_full_50_37]|uniref:Secretion system C-terminal sorting domain-containing protein n=1 Tax=Candidatus Raymondbacteria bacterium RIFOXYD12_FULL_49_13 TaxID=1817890 RepID=A0A1F7FA44_UNCRA|nr:MAG: hypothetical protein A2268_00685 [Candidatus Raymondbacteria bacterium RifOxyA12_full_50_37]OGJ90046.1 MAG: hypothetical protein A2248_19015 [Candidatus Raymondbacteria bacterium RIFOXYA2_FULL_49_16]OGJ96730.1 MAG: hypothetical protein A2453_06140 [Candidatus Raymondbacteria bacterium RIFOXYC2_FULL_50_21]OGK03481.1 MAG: hypothetical protein A2519_15715 [Candidatus Raymondbacteria bacterium RIFOXYD12_FULL_49_13]OGP42266.1 MAG: hypothetical protein A2324_01150 [Candidatus Raymondbacteria 
MRLLLITLAFFWCAAAFAADTVSIVAVMVEFQEDALDDFTTGRGLFGSNPGDFDLDNKPHGRAYFENHLAMARAYFTAASDSNMVLQYAVYPRDNTALKVPFRMKHYRPPAKSDSESWDEYYDRLNKGIMAFSLDAMRAASRAGVFTLGATIGPVTVSERTLFLIFHAGASGLIDGGALGKELGADSPSDLIDSYIAPVDFSYYHGARYFDDATTVTLSFDRMRSTDTYGVYAADSSRFVDNLLICSETASQDSINFGINGIIVNQVARALGLPNLFNTKTGETAIGGFCLMDFAGYNTVNGFIPIYPSAWCRERLGWVAPLVAEPPETTNFSGSLSAQYTLYSMMHKDKPVRMIKVPLSSTEYLLLENRQYPDSLVVQTDSSRYTYPARSSSHSAAEYMLLDSLCEDPDNCSRLIPNPRTKSKGSITSVNNCDVGLPGFGVLVWHVDQTVIDNQINGDGVNSNMDRRGVDLVEADGIEDLGIKFSNILWTTYSSGGPEDFFPHSVVGKNNYVTDLTPFSGRLFSTTTNTGAYTGITVSIDTIGSPSWAEYTNASASIVGINEKIRNYAADSFKVTVTWDLSQGSWPQATDSLVSSPQAVHVDTSLYYISPKGVVFSFCAHGGLPARDTLAAGIRSATAPSVKGTSLVVASCDSGRQGQYIREYNTVSKTSAVLYALAADTLSTLISVMRDTLYFGTRHSYCYEVSAGVSDSLLLGAGKIAALAVDSTQVYAVCDKTLLLLQRHPLAVSKRITIPGLSGASITMAVGNIDRTTPGKEIVLADNKGNVVLLSATGALLQGWPVKIATTLALMPSLGDVDGDHLLDIVIPGNNTVYAFNYTGTSLTHWPYTVSARQPVGQITATASLSDLDNNGDMEVFVPLPNGTIVILDNDALAYEFTVAGRAISRSLAFGGEPGPSCVVANLDVDTAGSVPEHIEIYTVNNSGYLSCFNVPISGTPQTAWETAGGTLARTSVYAGPSLQYSEPQGPVSVDTLFTYPNPTRTNSFTVKYRLSTSATIVRAKLFNTAGNRVYESARLPTSALWNHFSIDVSKYAPGMYMLKIEAEGSGESDFAFTKVGIIK